MRSDLTPIQQLVQASHAIAESARRWPGGLEHPHFVLLAVPDEPSLKNLLENLLSKGVEVHPWTEEDLCGSLTAIATAPVSGPCRRLFRHLPLLSFVEVLP